METKKAKAMVKRINDRNGDEVARLFENYSGRGMYGRTTTAVTLPSWAIPRTWKGSRDSLGLESIIY
jgi:hypothetical protein